MATILLSRHSSTESPQSSLYKVFKGIEDILQEKHNIIPLPKLLPEEKDIKAWLVKNALRSDIVITTHPLLIRLLREAGWRGKVILKALGGFPRGAITLREALPYLYKTDIIWCSSTADWMIYQALVKQDGSQPEAVVLPYGIDGETFTPLDQETQKLLRHKWGFSPNDFVLVYAGRVTIEKNVHSILEIIRALNNWGKKVKLVIAGRIEDVPFREFNLYVPKLSKRMDVMIKSLGLLDVVVIKPWLDPKRLNELFNAADVLINLTLHHDENFGFSQVEAMSAGLPVVATAWGGLKDTIIDGQTGFLADTWTSEYGIRFDLPKVIDAVRTLIENPELRRKMGSLAKCHVLKNYSWPVYSRKVLRLVDYLLKGNNEKSCPHYTDFGHSFHSRFSSISKLSKRQIAKYPLYTSFSDPDYIHLIKPYTSRDQTNLTSESNLFLALPGRIKGKFFLSNDLLWPVRIPVNSYEIEILQQLDRWHPIPRRILKFPDDTINALLRKGLVGTSYRISVQEVTE